MQRHCPTDPNPSTSTALPADSTVYTGLHWRSTDAVQSRSSQFGSLPPKSRSKRRLHYTVVEDLSRLFAYLGRSTPACSSDPRALIFPESPGIVGAYHYTLAVPSLLRRPLFIVCRCCLFDEAVTGRMTWGLTPFARRDVTGTGVDVGRPF